MLLKLVIGLLIAYVIFRLGMWFLRGLAVGQPSAPPPGELRRVSLRYRCTLCGIELKVTAAPNEEPEPPRHCMEDMEPVAPAIE